MALRASTRRDQRRRLLAARNASAQGAAAGHDDQAAAGSATPYDEAARPERHPALATRLPVSASRLLLAILTVLVVFGGAIGLAVSGPLLGRPLIPQGGRFARTLAVVAGAFDPRGVMPVQVWLAELALLAAAAVAGSVRFMRRHRRDDYKGRFRAWGWLAAMLAVAAWAGAVPLGPMLSALASDASGLVLGPDGIGWWLGLATAALAIVIPWAVLPLRERGATAFWMTLAVAAWSVAAATPWAGPWVGGEARAVILGQAAWSAGAGLMLIAMLAAARSVIREVRGQCGPVRVRPPRAPQPDVAADQDEAAEPSAEAASEEAAWDESGEHEAGGYESDDDDGSGGDFVDGSEQGQRRLSKAERKRLRKLARMRGDAA
jgi:hypothetical protein